MFTLPALPYAYNELEPYIDEQTMHFHHEKHHAGYVDKTNALLEGQSQLLTMDIIQLFKNFSLIPSNLRTKFINFAGGHANHTLFWQIMSPKKDQLPQSELAILLNKTFGSFKVFQEKFSQTALDKFGSGWAWLVLEKGKLSITDTSNQDSPLLQGKIPILGLDVWEHAYYLKYQNRRPDYIKAFFNVINWEKVNEHYLAAKK